MRNDRPSATEGQRADRRSDEFISKKMSYCLRHNPGKYGLTLDPSGFVLSLIHI